MLERLDKKWKVFVGTIQKSGRHDNLYPIFIILNNKKILSYEKFNFDFFYTSALYNINFVVEHYKNFFTSIPNKDVTNKPVALCNSTSTRHIKSNHKT